MRVLLFEPLWQRPTERPWPTLSSLTLETDGVDVLTLYPDEAKAARVIEGMYARMHLPGWTGRLARLELIVRQTWRAFLQARRFREYDAVILLGKQTLVGAFLSSKLGRGRGPKVLYYTYSSRLPKKRWMRRVMQGALDWCDRVVYISEHQVTLHEPPEKARALYIGMDSTFFDPALAGSAPEVCRGAYLVVGNAGRNERVVEQLAEMSERPVVRITRRASVIAHYDELLARRPELSGRLTLLRDVPYEDLRGAYASCHGVVLPLVGEDEPWGLTATLEAMMMGKAVLTDHVFTYQALREPERAIVQLVEGGDWRTALSCFEEHCTRGDSGAWSAEVRAARSLPEEARRFMKLIPR